MPEGGARVGLIMGSDSDWPVMEAAAHALAEFDIPFEVGVVSAHRTPDRMLDYARTAADRGIEVIIAGAGGAAHLPGMVASVPAEAVWTTSRDSPTIRSTGPCVTSMCWTRK